MLTLFASWCESQYLDSCRVSKLSKAILPTTPPVVSGLSSSKVLVCSLTIKEFCGGKAGWNDSAIFIKTESRALSPNQKRLLSDIIKSVDKAMPKCFALCSIRTPISLCSQEIIPSATLLFLL